MPNTVVKLTNAESTWLEAAWEDRKLLIKMKSISRMTGAFYFVCKKLGIRNEEWWWRRTNREAPPFYMRKSGPPEIVILAGGKKRIDHTVQKR
jgi:hypothetical protein